MYGVVHILYNPETSTSSKKNFLKLKLKKKKNYIGLTMIQKRLTLLGSNMH